MSHLWYHPGFNGGISDGKRLATVGDSDMFLRFIVAKSMGAESPDFKQVKVTVGLKTKAVVQETCLDR